jgi:hypothetical protein
MTISSLLTQPQNFGLSHFVLLQKNIHLIEHVDGSLFSSFQKLLLGIGEYHPKNEQEEVSLGCVFPMHPRISVDRAAYLENFFVDNTTWWPLAARIHAKKSQSREMQSRMALSNQQIPFVMPNSLHETQIHAIAAGHLILHVFHADWLRKLSSLVLETLALDVDNEGLWLYDILPSLDEKVARRKVEGFLKKRSRSRYGSKKMAVAVLYGYQLGLDVEQYEQKLDDRERLLIMLGKECTKKIME